MLLICEACHRRWKLPPREKRRATCPRCHRKRVNAGQRHGWMIRRRLREARREAPATGPAPTWAELQKLMDDADAAAAKALKALATIKPVGV